MARNDGSRRPAAAAVRAVGLKAQKGLCQTQRDFDTIIDRFRRIRAQT